MSQPPESWAPAGRPPHAPENARCSLCGTTHPAGEMVSDGGEACADVRWYCKDVLACTQSWTARSPAARRRAAATPATAPRPDAADRNPADRNPADRNPADRNPADRNLADRPA